MADRRTDRDDVRDAGPSHQREKPTDVGRTMGGGSLGHAPAEDVSSQTGLRNNPPGASPGVDRLRKQHGGREGNPGVATGSEDDPVMPEDDATLKTKI